jgi:DNA polymerase-3 subunit beta
MEFKIEKKKLMTAVELASNAVAKKTTNPILSGILLDIKENELNIYATDL